ncbi:NAD(P)-dependent dehydrogenase, short-chain alcohol dehydrogenase family [Mesobacillus persicus]|uniref:NAD(P)-dependent dehydrogenase, short-chain alcohol dehydrogenase family n=1 Tax=Mesobacillus persicus TaxID=930146 RepID=A0A1H8D9B1_9BACI|nr:SDR family oxidoreductase [Mesobacillus persicus]SEN03951.1 NAD(P)-dependent dehydrogenase, short-chain alcohol dehydrogenase family [Mesobacillus persicus]
MGKLDGKVAIITGSGQGLGLAYAMALAKEGAAITIAEFNEETGSAAAREINAGGGNALFVQCDVAKESEVQQVVKRTVEEFGTVDILINNAQASSTQLIVDTTEEHMELAWRTGTLGTLFFMKACFPYLKIKGGRIINTCSATGIEGMKTFAAYGSAKEAIRGLTKTAAREFGEYNITVNVVSPGALTPAAKSWRERDPEGYKATMAPVPLQRLGDPDGDIAPGIVFLASDDSRFMTGQTIYLDGGHTFGR